MATTSPLVCSPPCLLSPSFLATLSSPPYSPHSLALVLTIKYNTAFSPSTGRVGTSTGSGGYREGYALQNCAGYPPTATDCVLLLVCVDCYGAVSVTDRPINGKYRASVATGMSSVPPYHFLSYLLSLPFCRSLGVVQGSTSNKRSNLPHSNAAVSQARAPAAHRRVDTTLNYLSLFCIYV